VVSGLWLCAGLEAALSVAEAGALLVAATVLSCFRHWDTQVDFTGSYPPVPAPQSIQTGWTPIDRSLGSLS
jgi:hypothetical protein